MTNPEHSGRSIGVRFGGWPDYAEWSAYDFRERTAQDEAGAHPEASLVVEVLTHLSPITLPPAATDEGCRLHPDDECEHAYDDEDVVLVHLDIDLEAALIRPYVRTGGRVEAAHPLEFESILTSTGRHRDRSVELADDQLQLCEHCQSPQSVAEIAVALNAPVAVVKVMISDAIERGLLMLHETTPLFAGRPPVALLKRVHASLSRLS
jgi:hypothetical protein